MAARALRCCPGTIRDFSPASAPASTRLAKLASSPVSLKPAFLKWKKFEEGAAFGVAMDKNPEEGKRPSFALRAAETLAPSTRKSISQRFSELRENNEIAVIPFIVAGDPDLETSAQALIELDRNGADIIELGVPYSDPLADGPVIQAAATRALSQGVTLECVLTMLKNVSPQLNAPIVLFTYYNPIMKKGIENFMRTIREAGAAGLVVPDVPLEETSYIRKVATENSLELVLLTTPTTPRSRMESIANATQGFLYLVSLTGVTGARASVEGRVQSLLEDIKQATQKPVAVGFGISRPEHAAQVVEWGADGVIIGSAIVKLLANIQDKEEGIKSMVDLIRSIKQAVHK